MSKTTVNWAIFGPGFIANLFAKGFPHSDKAKLLGVGARRLEKAQEFAARHGIERVYGSLTELCADPDIDAVYLATTTRSHYELMLQILRAGKHVLAEKEITMNHAQYAECVRVAKENGVICAEGLTSVYEPVMPFIKKKIASGEYGKLHFITVTCGSLKPYDKNNRYFSPELGGGAIFDIGCYAIGFANYFLSSYPTEVLSKGLICDTGVDQKSAYILSNKEQEYATVMINLRSKTEKIGIIACEDAFIRIEGFIRANKATVTFEDGRVETYQFPVRQLDAEVEALTDDILAGRDDCTLCPSHLSLSVLEVMDKAREQWGYKFDFEEE